MRPRTDHKDLEKYHEGLIICSACLGGEIPQKIMQQNLQAAEDAILWFKGYLEMITTWNYNAMK